MSHHDKGSETAFFYRWKKEGSPKLLQGQFSAGVSLHGHTWHSHESLAFLPNAIKNLYFLPKILHWAEEKHKEVWKRDFDYSKGYWTSPVPPAAARELESRQIRTLGLEPIISLTDHDSIAAHDAAPELAHDPISFEWTAPYKRAVFHIGIHNLPAKEAKRVTETCYAYTARTSHEDETLATILHEIATLPGTLVVFNHPLSDQGRIGFEIHESRVKEFLQKHRDSLHALEVNTMQTWDMNRRVVAMANDANLPIISGGDRHGLEPNGVINVTNARSFDEFVHEIRSDKQSNVLFMPQAHRSLVLRYAENVKTIMNDYPELTGRWSWYDRVFYECPDGVTRSFTEMIGKEHTYALDMIDMAMGTLGIATHAIRPIVPVFRESKRRI